MHAEIYLKVKVKSKIQYAKKIFKPYYNTTYYTIHEYQYMNLKQEGDELVQILVI